MIHGSGRVLVAAVVLVSSVLVAAGACGTVDGSSDQAATPTPTQTMSATKVSIANLLPASEVDPAPPGDVLVESMGPWPVTGMIPEPSRQVMTCTPRVLSPEGDPAPEPDAEGAASSGFVTGVAQVDLYAVAYTDDAAARSAVERARTLADDCDAAFAVHSPGAKATATITDAPAAVEGFGLHATYADEDTGHRSDEYSAVLRSGRTVLYLRANEGGAPKGMDWETDGMLDPAWADQLVDAAAAHLAE